MDQAGRRREKLDVATSVHRPIVLAAVLAVAFVAVNLIGTHRRPLPTVEETGEPYVSLYTEPDTAAEVLVNQGDGQAFAALAQDPTLSRPEVFDGAAEAAYRAQRPVLGWLVWLSTAGRAAAVPGALLVWAVLGSVVLVAAAALLAADLGRSTLPAALALALPGSLADLDWTGPDALAAGLALLGVWRWGRSDVAGAVALFTVATLTRETMLLVVVAIVLVELWRSRRITLRVSAFAVCPLALGVWWLVVRQRLGDWPTEASHGRLGLPFRGFAEGLDFWSPAEATTFVVGGLLVAAAVRRRGHLGPIGVALWTVVITHGVLASVMGVEVWKRWQDFGRALLPLYAAALVLALPLRSDRADPERTFPTGVTAGR